MSCGRKVALPLLAGLSLGLAPAAQAAPLAATPAEHRDGVVQLTPYLWAAGLKGQISPFQRGPSIGIKKSFSDVMNDLNVGGFVNLWARQGRYVFSGDVMYVNTSSGHGVGPMPALPVPGVGVIPAGGDVEAKIGSRQFTATLLGGYRVLERPGVVLDAMAGVRFWHIANDVRLSGSLGGVSETVSYKESFGWADPLLGLRAFVPLTERWSLQGQADIGGFGAAARFTWSALATVNYRFNERFSASAGYKVTHVDYAHDGHVYDTRLGGPVLGVTYRF